MLLGGDREIISVIHCQTRVITLQSVPARNDTCVDALQVGEHVLCSAAEYLNRPNSSLLKSHSWC